MYMTYSFSYCFISIWTFLFYINTGRKLFAHGIIRVRWHEPFLQTHMTLINPCKYNTSLGISRQAGKQSGQEVYEDEITEVETVSEQQITEE